MTDQNSTTVTLLDAGSGDELEIFKPSVGEVTFVAFPVIDEATGNIVVSQAMNFLIGDDTGKSYFQRPDADSDLEELKKVATPVQRYGLVMAVFGSSVENVPDMSDVNLEFVTLSWPNFSALRRLHRRNKVATITNLVAVQDDTGGDTRKAWTWSLTDCPHQLSDELREEAREATESAHKRIGRKDDRELLVRAGLVAQPTVVTTPPKIRMGPSQ